MNILLSQLWSFMKRILSRIFLKVSLLLAPWCNTSIFMHDVKKYQINIITWHWHFSFILTRCIDNFLDICQPMMAMLTSEITFLNSQSFSVIKIFFWRFVHFQKTFKNIVPDRAQLFSLPKKLHFCYLNEKCTFYISITVYVTKGILWLTIISYIIQHFWFS